MITDEIILIMSIDTNNPVVKLCIEGTQAEFAGRLDEAEACYRRAWESAKDDYEACIAAHYMARGQKDAQEVFRWNQEALQRADKSSDERVKEFYPSIYLNMGKAYDLLGKHAEALRYYTLAAELGYIHQAE
jgi:tetratricopeptide (TPR) repeat protein